MSAIVKSIITMIQPIPDSLEGVRVRAVIASVSTAMEMLTVLDVGHALKRLEMERYLFQALCSQELVIGAAQFVPAGVLVPLRRGTAQISWQALQLISERKTS